MTLSKSPPVKKKKERKLTTEERIELQLKSIRSGASVKKHVSKSAKSSPEHRQKSVNSKSPQKTQIQLVSAIIKSKSKSPKDLKVDKLSDRKSLELKGKGVGGVKKSP